MSVVDTLDTMSSYLVADISLLHYKSWIRNFFGLACYRTYST